MARFKFFRTIRGRFAALTAGLLAIALVAFGLFVYASMRRALYQAIDDELLLAADATSAIALEDGRLIENEPITQSLVTARSRSQDISIRLLGHEGQVLHTSGEYPFTKALPVTYTSSFFVSYFEPKRQVTLRYYSAPIVLGKQTLGTVQVAQSLSAADGTLRQLSLVVTLGIPVLITLAAISAYFIASRTLEPIDQMTRTAFTITASDLSARIELPNTQDEVSRLAATFDEMLDRLESSFQRERRFIADASHELRTPLTAMNAILSVIREQRRTVEDYEAALDDLNQVNNRMRALVEKLLQVARAESAARTVRETVNLSQLVCDLCETMQGLAEQKQLRLVCACSDGILVLGDADALLRLFINLLDNAIKYTDTGEVHMRSEVDAAHKLARIRIRDTGRGIPPQDLLKIFDRFYRADPSRSAAGFGLGLTIAQDIARSHGGHIEASSMIGEGTTFTVTLPMLPPPGRGTTKKVEGS